MNVEGSGPKGRLQAQGIPYDFFLKQKDML